MERANVHFIPQCDYTDTYSYDESAGNDTVVGDISS